MKVRNAELRDVPQIIRFKKDGYKISFPGQKLDIGKFREKLSRYFEKEPEGIKVIEEDGKIIGYVWFFSKIKANEKYGFIEHVFIDRRHRGRGLAEKLLKLAEDYFRSKRIRKIKLVVTLENEPAIKLYEKFKYKKTRVTMEKAL